MIDIIDLQSNKETIVRKRITNFIEKLYRYINLDFDHDRYKSVVYSEDFYKTLNEIRIKKTYDSFLYLLFNRKNPLTEYILKTFFYIYFGNEINDSIIITIINIYFRLYDNSPIDKAIKFHIEVYKELSKFDKEDRLIISLIMFNYALASREIGCIQLLKSDIAKYEELRDECIEEKEYEKLKIFFIEIIKKNKFQDKSFYNELEPLDVKGIYSYIYENKEEIINSYKVRKIYMYGSFVKGINRIDSDIDLLVVFDLDLLVEEKDRLKNELIKYLEKRFKRYVDIHEMNGYLSKEFIKTTKRVKEII